MKEEEEGSRTGIDLDKHHQFHPFLSYTMQAGQIYTLVGYVFCNIPRPCVKSSLSCILSLQKKERERNEHLLRFIHPQAKVLFSDLLSFLLSYSSSTVACVRCIIRTYKISYQTLLFVSTGIDSPSTFDNKINIDQNLVEYRFIIAAGFEQF